MAHPNVLRIVSPLSERGRSLLEEAGDGTLEAGEDIAAAKEVVAAVDARDAVGGMNDHGSRGRVDDPHHRDAGSPVIADPVRVALHDVADLDHFDRSLDAFRARGSRAYAAFMTMKPKTLEEPYALYRETCLRFARKEIEPHAVEWEEAESFPRELFARAGAAGILGAGFPEALGGSGEDVLMPLVGIEGLMAGGSTGVVAGLGSLGIALPPILHLGTPEQQRRFVPPVLAGEKIAALAITEPGTGSDVAGVRTRAVRDGEHYVLDGAKMFITSGCRADLVTVLARTGDDPHGGLTFFVVERGTPGFSVSRALKKTGWRASDTAELVFEGARVPAENRLGDEGSGFVALMRNFQQERLALAFMGHATAEIALRDALEYARQREAFGRPIAKFQVIRHKLARMATQVTAARELSYAVARRVAAGEYLPAEVSMAKNFAAEVAEAVCREAVQVFGGMGYMRETRVERLSRDARLLAIGGGTTEVMNEVIARWGLQI